MKIGFLLMSLLFASMITSCAVTTSANETPHAAPSPTATEAVITPTATEAVLAEASPTASPEPTVRTPTPTIPMATPFITDTQSVTPSPPAQTDATESPTVNLIDPGRELAVAGEDNYEHQRVASADFDNDGEVEKAFLIANAFVIDGQTAWDDGHTWQVYVEEPTGERTHVFVQFVQLGMIEAMVVEPEQGQAPTIVLLKRHPFEMVMYEITYNGPHDFTASELVRKTLLPGPDTMFMPPSE